MTAIKICGLTSVEDARRCVALGVEALGVNLVPSSPRVIDRATARAIVEAVGDRALVVAVVADLPVAEMLSLRADTGVGCLQLHGAEPPDALTPLLPHAYKALRVGDPSDVAAIARYPGEHVLVDAKVPGVLGGSGHVFDWALVVDVARARKLTLAGGLNAGNVGRAIEIVRPFAVDIASGVELPGAPRKKDEARLAELVRAVRAA